MSEINQQQDEYQHQRSSLVRSIHAEISKPDYLVRGRLPETIFVRDFLPTFAAKKGTPNQDEVIAVWFCISDGPLRPVDILDNAGNVLYTVPPVQNTRIFNPLNDSDIRFKDVVATAKQVSMMSPVAGDNVITGAVDAKFNAMFDPARMRTDDEKTWDSIFQRYPDIVAAVNDEPETAAATAEKVPAEQTKGFLDDDMMF